MPSKVYRHPGGLGEERARLLSISDGVDYQSGSEGGASSSTSALPRPLQAARSASLQLVAEMDSSTTAEAVVKSKSDTEMDINAFTDLTEYGEEEFKHYK